MITNAIARMPVLPLAAMQHKLAELMLDWQEFREERRRLREFDEHLLRELNLIRTDIRRSYRNMRFTRSLA
jgi:uncharacterized protein YjiS (DUF1127 family)